MAILRIYSPRFRKLFISSLLCFSMPLCFSFISLNATDLSSKDNSTVVSHEKFAEYSVGDLYFSIDFDSGEAKFLRSTLSSVDIPEVIKYKDKSYVVTSIADNAFINRIDLTRVSIPNSVKSIGSKAFYGCWKLSDIVIPESVETIGDYSFWNCSAPTSIEILGDNLKSIGKKAFADCYSLKILNIPDSVVSIGENAFANCKSLSSIQISGNFDRHKFDISGVDLKKDKNLNYTGEYSVKGTSVEGILSCKEFTTMNCFCNSVNEAIAIDLIVNKWGGNK